jgi:hypothetical protein
MGQERSSKQPPTKRKDSKEIPILHYGPNNCFTKFKEGLLNEALKPLSWIGKLIELGEYHIRNHQIKMTMMSPQLMIPIE